MARDRLVWIDLEMTGLDPQTCTIVEIATLITHVDLEVLAEGPCLVVHQSPEVLAAMHPEVVTLHQRSGLLELIGPSEVSLERAESETLAFVQEHCDKNNAPLCGNSIWKDRQFLERYMPRLSDYLHYRNIDVSTIKELARRWYPSAYAAPNKRESHRALDDIRESIEELKWYRDHLFVRPIEE
jgi:oligoribonuclease